MGLAAALLEQAGIATVVLSCFAPITEKVAPPRWLDLPFPLGFPVGPPNDPTIQRQVLLAALSLLEQRGENVRALFSDDGTGS